jgi:hypothetical protein
LRNTSYRNASGISPTKEDEATKDVKWLSDVREAPYMVPLNLGRVIFSLEDGFT